MQDTQYAIISDIHANLAALERVLADAERCGVEKVVCAGDVVGYGPDPAGAIRILRERDIPTVMGNHDAAVAGWRDTGKWGKVGPGPGSGNDFCAKKIVFCKLTVLIKSKYQKEPVGEPKRASRRIKTTVGSNQNHGRVGPKPR